MTIKHGHTNGGKMSPTYNVWAKMRHRCKNPNSRQWKHYGGRGITICERWDNFNNFLADMGERPNGLTIERIDNERGYEPGNCRWATRMEQANNRRNNVLLTVWGKTQSISAWSRELGLQKSIIPHRLARGWTLEEAVSK